MAGGATSGQATTQAPQQSVPASFDFTGYTNQRGPDPFSGYAPPPVQMAPFVPSRAASGFGIFGPNSRQRQQYSKELEAYNKQKADAEAAQQAQITASRQQIERSLNPMFGGYRSARQAPQQFRGGFSSPFSYTQPQPSYFEPQPINPFAMQQMPQPAPAQQPSMFRPMIYENPNQPVAPPTPVTIGGQSPTQIGAGSGFGGLAGLLGRFR
jgi:hypothetical protein